MASLVVGFWKKIPKISNLKSDFFLILQKKLRKFQNSENLFVLNIIWANFEQDQRTSPSRSPSRIKGQNVPISKVNGKTLLTLQKSTLPLRSLTTTKMGRGVVGRFRLGTAGLGTAGLVSFPLYFVFSFIFPSFHSFAFFRFFFSFLSLLLFLSFLFFYFIFFLLLKYRTCKTSLGVG